MTQKKMLTKKNLNKMVFVSFLRHASTSLVRLYRQARQLNMSRIEGYYRFAKLGVKVSCSGQPLVTLPSGLEFKMCRFDGLLRSGSKSSCFPLLLLCPSFFLPQHFCNMQRNKIRWKLRKIQRCTRSSKGVKKVVLTFHMALNDVNFGSRGDAMLPPKVQKCIDEDIKVRIQLLAKAGRTDTFEGLKDIHKAVKVEAHVITAKNSIWNQTHSVWKSPKMSHLNWPVW